MKNRSYSGGSGVHIDRDGYVTDTESGTLLGRRDRESDHVWWAKIGRNSTMATSRYAAIEIIRQKHAHIDR
ncbi:MAG TPA: hypothetical protein VGC45_15700 [Gryllotalpicola sp.]